MIINSVNYSSGELDYIPITTYQELIDAFATSNTKPLRLMNDLTAIGDEIRTNKTNTLDLHGHTITGNFTFKFLVIDSGGNVTLCDLADTGGGTITMFGRNGNGGGVIVYGTFTMNGGTITNCSGGNGGGVLIINGTFNMNGGTISDCKAPNSYGGGVYVNGTFNMTGGNITNCTAEYGGGVYVMDKFNMNGGSISGCNATYGGGADVEYGTFNIGGTAIIQNNLKNTATNNVYNDNGTISLASNFTGNIGICYPTPSSGGTIGTATAGVTGAENIHADSTRTLIGVVSDTTLKWKKAT